MQYTVPVEFEVVVEIGKEAPNDVFTRTQTKDFRENLYDDLETMNDVLDHFAYNCAINGVNDASRLDGWADLPKGAVRMYTVW